MTREILEIRSKWQNYRQELMRADYNHADEALGRALHFADNTPIIKSILQQIRLCQAYKEFDADSWLSGRSHAGCLGCGRTNLNFSYDELKRTAQSLKVLELAKARFEKDDDGLLQIGYTTYGGSSSHLVDHIRSAVETIFDPFYNYVDLELGNRETLITPVDIMSQIQNLVDSESSSRYPETHRLLAEAYGQLFASAANDSDATWNGVGYKCRDTIMAFAKEIFKPAFVPDGQDMPKEDDAGNKLKWSVRHYLKAKRSGNRYRESIEKIIESNWKFVSNLGHRHDTADEFDARLGVIYTYMTVWVVDNIIVRSNNREAP